MADTLESQLEALTRQIDRVQKDLMNRSFKDLIIVQNRIYSQIEALTWLSRALTLSGSLPPLRGWAASPDVLLRLHEHIRFQKPKVVVECGSGSSTLVIADALRQNGEGVLVSLEHSTEFGGKTRSLLEREGLSQWVDLRIGELEDWDGPHLNDGKEETIKWYSSASLTGIQNIDLLFVDGPPGATCKYARYPALPALVDRLAPRAQVWMDDTVRQEEVDISKDWAKRYGYSVEFFSLEKGLGVLIPNERQPSSSEEGEQASSLNWSVNSEVSSALQQHVDAWRPACVLQFGVSANTLPLAESLKAAGGGRAVIIAEPSDEADALKSRLEAEGLASVMSVVTEPLEDWGYRHLPDCERSLKKWFSEGAFESLPTLDWVIVDGPDFQGQPCSRYPAFPSVLEKMSPHAELWMLGAQDSRVQQVVKAWCEHYPARRDDTMLDEGVIRITL
ncbi:O-methyltransferase [Marinimicrobium agarilyticum]|uniref:O-methyltransferase n=1 Tax=Marinimicrobium agarilyticum TaxID=306546 RepID=UPI000411983B|nr:class I SAM-dependent methyltransferase [Marinimicrobium agarilyticum]